MSNESDAAWARYAFISKWAPELVANDWSIDKAIEIAGRLHDKLQEIYPE